MLSRWALPDRDVGILDYESFHAVRVDSFDVTGSLVWLQAEALEDMSPYDMERDVKGST